MKAPRADSKIGHEFHGTWNQESLCWQGQAAISSEPIITEQPADKYRYNTQCYVTDINIHHDENLKYHSKMAL